MTIARDQLSKAESVRIAAIEAAAPALVEARRLVERFHAMLRKKIVTDLEVPPAVAPRNGTCAVQLFLASRV
jgi:hypothetical protein